jgi:hypothetical protein
MRSLERLQERAMENSMRITNLEIAVQNLQAQRASPPEPETLGSASTRRYGR